ncbi:MAG: metallophosphoesterase [Peptococcaceae bacterium]|jgi:predicted MPP superfamily phosphohydrolase|nr:metallophosphoesterase [Peptococcaceae bacterium]
MTRRTFIRRLTGFIASHKLMTAIPVSIVGASGWLNHDSIALRMYAWDLYYPQLSPVLEGKCLIQLSDLHLYTLRISAERIAAILRKHQPDLVVFTGDLVSARADLDKSAAYLSALRTSPACYFVPGNHDYRYFSSSLFNRYTELIQESGWILLRNQSEFLPELDLWVIGIDDPSTSRDNVKLAYTPLLEESVTSFRLALAHSSDCLDFVAKYGADLLLTGHTHGGQIRLPGLKPFITNTYLGDKGIYEGYHIIQNIPLYINRGIGCSRLPFRLNVLPEITKFTLHQGTQPPECTILPY